jgi:hypothetical protein
MAIWNRGSNFLDRHPLLVGAVAGLIAGAVTAQSDRLLDRLVSDAHKRRDRRVRKGSAHEVAGPYFAEKLSGRRLSRQGKKRARLAFGVAYGLGWGLLHGRIRRRFPSLTRLLGLPFAVPFFFACDGCIAPLLGVSPRLTRIPWQPSLKEMGNHITWTAVSELVHRLAGRTR